MFLSSRICALFNCSLTDLSVVIGFMVNTLPQEMSRKGVAHIH